MYGEEKLNAHNTLRYGLTKEFFEQFKSLRYKGIEIPLTLIRSFHVYIKDYVIAQKSNTALAARYRAKHKLVTMRNVQTALVRKPKIERNLAKISHRTTTMMPAKLVDFALDKMKSQPVVLVVADKKDLEALKGKRLPRSFKKFDYHQAMRSQRVAAKTNQNVKRIIYQLVRKNTAHPIFGTSAFSKWLYTQSIKSIKIINTLEHFIRKNPVGVMIDHVEIVNPGTTLALLANKFNLPYVNIPQLLIADRSLIPTRASYHFVWGKNYKEWLQRRGIHSSKIKMTGNLRFQYEKQSASQPKAAFLDRHRIPSSHKILVYTSQPFDGSVNAEIMRWIDGAAKPDLPVTILIKPHPYDTFDYSGYTASKNVKLLSKDEDLYAALRAADAVMTISSNTAIEGAQLNKGIIVLQPQMPYNYDHHNNDFNEHLAQASAGLVAKNERQLSSYISRYVRSEKLRSLLVARAKQFLSKTLQLTKKPSDMTYRVIRNLIAQKRPVSRAVRVKLSRKRRLLLKRRRG
ncbi:CDP-glycerol glycerophosphotransferase family protein [Paenibacillus harenae]|uniref:CDP-glycerol glycerophosphotransferase family protein n=1 Tax=Paenibacillus harenae TaxID=306543 RepID=UPI0004069CF9|nr:CDP-glycerol glycerophosphotransferase family protein [Paenibacillus harenae]